MFSLKLENERGNVVDINDGVNYVVVSATGLNPPSASIFTTKSPLRKGSRYNGSTLNERNLAIQIKILGDVEANRNALYDWNDTEQYVKVRYKNGLRDVYCEGHIEDHSNDLFTDNEIVSLAILCENPYWKDLQEIVKEITDVLAQFTFAFAIDSAGIPISTIKEDNVTTVFNAGAETGLRITIKCSGAVKNITIYDATNPSRKFTLNGSAALGYMIEIDTTVSPKTVKLHSPDGSVQNWMSAIAPSPTWFTLKRGNNSFGFLADEGQENIEVSIAFTNNYLGV